MNAFEAAGASGAGANAIQRQSGLRGDLPFSIFLLLSVFAAGCQTFVGPGPPERSGVRSCQAVAFKEYLYFLTGIYSGMLADPSFRPAVIAGDRSMRGVLKRIGLGVKLRSLMSQREIQHRP
jgi:hypothetical protein